MTKGRALIEARHILGPSGHVRRTDAGEHQVGTFDHHGFQIVAVADSWGTALSDARNKAAHPLIAPLVGHPDTCIICNHRLVNGECHNHRCPACNERRLPESYTRVARPHGRTAFMREAKNKFLGFLSTLRGR